MEFVVRSLHRSLKYTRKVFGMANIAPAKENWDFNSISENMLNKLLPCSSFLAFTSVRNTRKVYVSLLFRSFRNARKWIPKLANVPCNTFNFIQRHRKLLHLFDLNNHCSIENYPKLFGKFKCNVVMWSERERESVGFWLPTLCYLQEG